MSRERKSVLFGCTMLLCAVAIWAGWIVLTRQAVLHELSPAALAFFRVLVPAVLLAPVIWRSGVFAGGNIGALVCSVAGAGAPFVFLAASGTRYASASDFAALVPGTVPLFVALGAMLVFRERIGWLRIVGFGCSTVGVFAITGRSLLQADTSANFGHMLMLTAAFFNAAYTFAFRRLNLTAVAATGVIAFWSTLLIAPFGLPDVIELARAGYLYELAFQAIVQGVFSGLLALIAYNIGIEQLGASRAAAFVALVPVAATLLGIPVLGEWPDIAAVIGVLMASGGVLLASGVLASGKAGRIAVG